MKSNFTFNVLLAFAWCAYAIVAVYLLSALATKPAQASIAPQVTKCVQIPDLRINDEKFSVKLICDDKGQQCELVEIIKLEPKTYFSPLSTECN